MPQGVRIYNLFPLLAGNAKEWEAHLDRIAGMGFDWIFLNPIHYPGFSGSLYAVKDYYALNPLFDDGSGDEPDVVVARFLKAAEARGIKVMMDLVVNHTAKDSLLAAEHPEWFAHEPDGSLASPFAVDPSDTSKRTVWADLAEIDYSERPERAALVAWFAGLVRHYVQLGFRGFRCDAAYKVSKDVWRTLIAAGQKESDDVLFVAENLGSLLEETLALRGAGFDYLFNSVKWWDFKEYWLLDQYEQFRSIAPSIAFPETHDTDRLINELAAKGITEPTAVEQQYRDAYLIAALFSSGVMIPIGYEYGFRKKLHVVKTRSSDWEKPAFDLTAWIAEVNRVKGSLPVLNEEGPQRALLLGDKRVACLLRRAMRGPAWVVTLINLERKVPVTARIEWLDGDVLEGREVTPGRAAGLPERPFRAGAEVTLAPGEVRVYANR
ncbi:MAG: alpha-amylase [Rhodospirillales bacterium]|nr:alpha-amylase [Rhodospirillales bacterium]